MRTQQWQLAITSTADQWLRYSVTEVVWNSPSDLARAYGPPGPPVASLVRPGRGTLGLGLGERFLID
jgi:hypothetical protein